MKKIIITLAFLTFSLIGFAQKTFTQATLNELVAEYKKDSHAFFNNRLSEDFRYINPMGAYQPQKDFLGGTAQNIVSTEILQPVIFQSGDLAVTSGVHHSVLLDKDGKEYTRDVAATYTWQRRNAKWLFVASQQTPVAPNTFDEATLNQMVTRWGNDPAGFVKNECDTKFIFTDGNGNSYNYQQAVDTYTNAVSKIDKKVENLKVWQSGNTGIATGKTIEGYKFKDGSSFTYTGIFTYTFSQSNGKWVLASAQHTDFRDTKEADEEAIRNIHLKEINSITKTRNSNDFLSCYAQSKDIIFGPYKNKMIIGYDELKTEAEELVKNNPNPSPDTFSFSNWNIKINGNTAFLTCLQTTTKPDGKQIEILKSDYLSKINGEWKIIDHRFFTKP